MSVPVEAKSYATPLDKIHLRFHVIEPGGVIAPSRPGEKLLTVSPVG